MFVANMRLLTLGFSLLAFSACGEDLGPLECPECEPPTPALQQIATDTTWLVRDVSFPVAASGATPGFDLDGIDSDAEDNPRETCEERQADYEPTLDIPITGVDDIGQGLVTIGEQSVPGHTFDGDLEIAVRNGVIRWALRVGPLSADREPLVTIDLFLVDPAETIGLDADGRPAADQTLRARLVATTQARVSGSAAWGAAANTEPLAPNRVFLMPLPEYRLGAMGIEAINSARLRAQIGGSFSVDALADALLFEAMLPVTDRDDALFIFQYVADIDPRAEDPLACERVSAAFELEAVPVVLVIE